MTAERVRASGDWPKLKAKAAATRHLAEYALNLAQRFARVDSLDAFTQTHDQMSLAACQLLVEFYALIRNESQTFIRGSQGTNSNSGESVGFNLFEFGQNVFRSAVAFVEIASEAPFILALVRGASPNDGES